MKKQLLLMAALILVLPMLNACFASNALNDLETALYQNEAAYSVQIPADWQLLSEDIKTTIYTNAEGTASLLLINELGGEGYYALSEIAAMISENLLYNKAALNLGLPAVETLSQAEIMGDMSDEEVEELLLSEDELNPEDQAQAEQIEQEMKRISIEENTWQQTEILVDRENNWRSIWQYQEEESLVTADIYIERPFDGMRYYLILIAGQSEYQQLEAIYSGIIASFEVDAERAELYQTMNEQRNELGAFVFDD